MRLTMDDYTRMTPADRLKLDLWAREALGTTEVGVFEIRLGEGYCEFVSYVRDAGTYVPFTVNNALLDRFTHTCPEHRQPELLAIKRRVRCALPPVWPLRRPS